MPKMPNSLPCLKHFPVQTRSEKENLGGLEAWPVGWCLHVFFDKEPVGTSNIRFWDSVNKLDVCWMLKGKVYQSGGVQQGGSRYRFPL